MWPTPVRESDVSQIWQDSLVTTLSQRADSQKHMQGTCASHLIHRHFLICPRWDQRPGLQRGPTFTQMMILPAERLRNIKDEQKTQAGQKKITRVMVKGTCWDVNNHLGWHL